MNKQTDNARFMRAVALVLRNEGGYVDNPLDAGGRTKFGICARSYPTLDIAALTESEAVAIYRRDWWERYNVGALTNDSVAAKVLDIAVNVGANRAVRMLQRALRREGRPVVVDGELGVATVTAANAVAPERILVAFLREAAAHYERLGAERPQFLAGWRRRLWSL